MPRLAATLAHVAAVLLLVSGCANHRPTDALAVADTAALPGYEQVVFRSVNYPDRFIRSDHQFLGTIAPLTDAVDGDSSFRLVRGLSGVPGSISFESVRFPGHYLRHQGFELKLHPHVATDLFVKDASFVPVAGLATASGTSFESVNYPGHFIRHRDFRLHLDPREGSELYRADATFITEVVATVARECHS